MVRKLALRLLIFCLLPLPFLISLNYIVDAGLKKSRNYYYTEWNDIFNSKINADLLIIGSSRAWIHISPKILDSVLNVNSYNIGMDASHFLMQNARFKLYLKYNKKPKYVIVSVDLTSFSESKEIPFPLQFLPYLNNPDIKNMTTGFDNSFSFAQRYFPLYKYNNQPELFTDGLNAYFDRIKVDTPCKYKGYIGAQRTWDNTFDQYKKAHPASEKLNVSSISQNEFKKFLNYCKINNINPIMVFTPVFHESLKYISNSSEILNFYKNISVQYKIPLLNYASDSLTYERRYFFNSQHLNKVGSEVFSHKLAIDLKKVVINKPLPAFNF